MKKLGQEWVSRVTNTDAPEAPSVIGGNVSPAPLRRDVWLERYARRFVEVGACDEAGALACSQAESFEVLSDGYEDDPEGAADMEMSYWEAD